VRGKRGSINIIGLLQAAAVLTVIFSLLTGIDISHPDFELFTHFRLQYFVVSVFLLAVFIFLRHYIYIGSLAVAAIFNAASVLPWYFAESATVAGDSLKLLHANVYSSNTEYERLIDLVAVEGPDMIFLQEVTPEWVAGTASLLQDYPYAYAEPRHGNFGIAAFSRIPFDSIQHIESPPLGYPTILATITINGKHLSIISSHPTIPLGQQMHDARNEQLQSIAGLVEKLAGEVILLGDLNSSVWDIHLRQLEDSTALRNVREGFGVLPSWPTYLPFAMIPIDHALVSKGVAVTDVRTGQKFGSDHLPLVVTLSL
jgi:endonuclease/exonuclease/phosphatase (EEP) superfamily protein YafD